VGRAKGETHRVHAQYSLPQNHRNCPSRKSVETALRRRAVVSMVLCEQCAAWSRWVSPLALPTLRRTVLSETAWQEAGGFFFAGGLHGAALVFTAQQAELEFAFHIERDVFRGLPGLTEQLFGGSQRIR
jgi:hypothetical protein